MTTPTAAATPGNGNGNGNGGGATNAGGSNAGGNNGNGSQPIQVAVAGRKVASPAGDGRSTLEVAPAPGTTSGSSPEATTGSPDDTSTLTSDAPSSTASESSAPDLADPSGEDAIPNTWRVAALAALFLIGLAVALLIAAATPRGGAHRRH